LARWTRVDVEGCLKRLESARGGHVGKGNDVKNERVLVDRRRGGKKINEEGKPRPGKERNTVYGEVEKKVGDGRGRSGEMIEELKRPQKWKRRKREKKGGRKKKSVLKMK